MKALCNLALDKAVKALFLGFSMAYSCASF